MYHQIFRENHKTIRTIGHYGATIKICGMFKNFNGRIVNIGNGFRGGRRSTSIPAIRMARARGRRPQAAL